MREVARPLALALTVLAMAALGAAPAQGAAGLVEDHSNDLFRQGLKRYLEHDYVPACALFKVGLQIGRRPSANGRAYYYYGECLLRAKLPGEAYWMFQRSYAFAAQTPQGQASFWKAKGLEGSPSIRVENRVVRPTSGFKFVYAYEPSPGLRTWTLDEAGKWHEQYPDGEVAKIFDRTHRGFVGCSGSIAALGSLPAFEVFVPDIGCPRMNVLFRDSGLRWRNLGPMLDAS